MKKVIGYVIAIAGLVLMALSFGLFNVESAFLEKLKPIYITSVGVLAIIVGVVISLMADKGSKGGPKQSAEEVPIYEGSGKDRKIVGYRRGETK